MKSILIPLLLALLMLSNFFHVVRCDQDEDFDQDCMEDNIKKFTEKVESQFDTTQEILDIGDARIKHIDDEGNVVISALWHHIKDQTSKNYIQNLEINNDDKITKSEIKDLNKVLFLDSTPDGQNYAEINIGDDSEQYLMVSTNNTSTSCTIRLSTRLDQGRVITNRVFGSFKFSPDGKYIMYQAEEPKPSGRLRYIFKGSFQGSPRLERPSVIIYDIEKSSFQVIESPMGFSPGQLQWHPDSKHIVGVAWPNDLIDLSHPEDTNKLNRLFVIHRSTGRFQLLDSALNHHFFQPRFSNNGSKLVLFENSLESATEKDRFYPGPYMVSSRLVCLNWHQIQEGGYEVDQIERYSEVIIDNGQNEPGLFPRVLPDGTQFYGFYPPMDQILPENIFSADSNQVYLNTYQLNELRLMAVDIQTRQITLHHQENLQLLDIRGDVILVRGGDAKQQPFLSVGRVGNNPPTTTTTTTTTTTIQTTTVSTPTTTIDPCDHLTTEFDKIVNDTTTEVSSTEQPTTAASNTTTTARTTNVTTTTIDPLTIPLDLGITAFKNLSAIMPEPVTINFYMFDEPAKKPRKLWTVNDTDDTFFNAFLIQPTSSDLMNSLVVVLREGPHSIATSGYDREVRNYLSIGLSVLQINYRGSLGMGDEVSHSSIGNSGILQYEDVEQVVQHVFENKTDLDVVLIGSSFGGSVATNLATTYPNRYKLLILNDPLIDFSSIRPISKYLLGLLGRNATEYVKPTANYLKTLLTISPIETGSKNLEVPTLIMNSDFNQGMFESQSLALHATLLSRNVTSKLVDFNRNEEELNKEKLRFTESMVWMYQQLGHHKQNCQVSTTTAGPSTTPNGGNSSTTPCSTASSKSSVGQKSIDTTLVLFFLLLNIMKLVI